MASSRRKMRRARARAAWRAGADLREIAPGVFDLALPIPPGMPPAQAAAAVAAFRAAVRDELGVELGPARPCTCPDCAPGAGT